MGNLFVTLELSTADKEERTFNPQPTLKDEKHCPDLRPQREPRLGQVLPRREKQQQVSSWRQLLQMRSFLRGPHRLQASHLDRSPARRPEEGEEQGRGVGDPWQGRDGGQLQGADLL